MRALGAVAALAGLGACLDSPPAALAPPPDADGTQEGDAATSPVCTWSAWQPLDEVGSHFAPTLDQTELLMVVAGGGILYLYERPARDQAFAQLATTWLATVNSAQVEGNAALSADANVLYFTRGGSEADLDVWVADRPSTDEVFGVERKVVGLSDPGIGESGVAVWEAGDLVEIIYAPVTEPGAGGLAHALCSANDLCEPLGLLGGIDLGADVGFPSISGDGLDLYFVQADKGIYSAHRPTPDGDFVVDAEQPIANTETTTYQDPEISQDGNTLYVVGRPVPSGAYTIQWSHRICE